MSGSVRAMKWCCVMLNSFTLKIDWFRIWSYAVLPITVDITIVNWGVVVFLIGIPVDLSILIEWLILFWIEWNLDIKFIHALIWLVTCILPLVKWVCGVFYLILSILLPISIYISEIKKFSFMKVFPILLIILIHQFVVIIFWVGWSSNIKLIDSLVCTIH